MSTLKVQALITDGKQFAAACASIRKRGAKLDADIQHAALSAIAHNDKEKSKGGIGHGNIGYVNMLFTSMPLGSRKSALTAWLLEFGMLRANDGDNKKEMPFIHDKERETNMVEAAANPWFTFKLDLPPDLEFDVIAALKAVIKKAQGKNTIAGQLVKVENLMRDLEQGVDTSAEAVTDPLEVEVAA